VTDVREQIEAVYWEHWRGGLRDNPKGALPALLDALELIINRARIGGLRAECDLLAAQLAEAAAERDRLRELLNEARIADPQPAPTEQAATPDEVKLIGLPAKPAAPVKPATARTAARRRTAK
jgi:hypothetical protein